MAAISRYMLLVLYASLLYRATTEDLVEAPANTFAFVGERAFLHCQFERSYRVRWMFYPVGSTTKLVIHSGHELNDEWQNIGTVETDAIVPERSSLHIYSVSLRDAGTYACQRSKSGIKTTAQLVILESDPICGTNVSLATEVTSNEYICIWCSVNYSGNVAPVMDWKMSGEELIGKVHNEIVFNQSVTYSLTVWTHRLVSGGRYTCTTYFQPQTFQQHQANNTMDYRYEWHSDPIKIIDPVGNNKKAPAAIIVGYTGYIFITILIMGCVIQFYINTQKRRKVTLQTRTRKLRDVSTSTLDCELNASVKLNSLEVDEKTQFLATEHVRYYPIGLEEEERSGRPSSLQNIDNVCGVAVFREELYLISRTSEVIQVFGTTYPYSFIRNIAVYGLRYPADLAVFEDKFLFISDINKCVWRMNRDGHIDKWAHGEGFPGTIFVAADGRLITMSREQNSINVYLPENRKNPKLFFISDEWKDLQHVVETKSGNFLVAFGTNPWDKHSICEISKEGRMVRQYGGKCGSDPRQLDHPYHMALDERGQIFVADYKNDRVVVLDSDLNLVRILVTDENSTMPMDRPQRLYYYRKTGLLYVGKKTGGVTVFQVRGDN